jgi:hypothetical protein
LEEHPELFLLPDPIGQMAGYYLSLMGCETILRLNRHDGFHNQLRLIVTKKSLPIFSIA